MKAFWREVERGLVKRLLASNTGARSVRDAEVAVSEGLLPAAAGAWSVLGDAGS